MPSDRPTFTDLVSSQSKVLASVADYMELSMTLQSMVPEPQYEEVDHPTQEYDDAVHLSAGTGMTRCLLVNATALGEQCPSHAFLYYITSFSWLCLSVSTLTPFYISHTKKGQSYNINPVKPENFAVILIVHFVLSKKTHNICPHNC